MPYETVIAATLFAVAAGFTPGPNNIYLASIGGRYGARAGVPYLTGVVIGFTFMVLVLTTGLGSTVLQDPRVQEPLQYVAAAVMFYLSWKIATAPVVAEGGAGEKATVGTVGAILFQWVNPKAWANASSGITLFFDPERDIVQQVVGLCLVFGAVTIVGASGWLMFGVMLRRWLTIPKYAQWFNYTMAALLAGTTFFLFL